MPFVSALVLAASTIVVYSLHNVMADFAHHAHNMCLKLIPFSQHEEIYRALICGKNLPDDLTRNLLSGSGLIHLLVVSGSHFLLLEQFFERFVPGNRTRLGRRMTITIILFLYANITLLNAPVLRSFLAHVFRTFDAHFELNTTELDRLKLSLVVALFLRPEFWTSLSLQMSTAASAALILAGPSLLRQSLVIYIVMFLFLASFGPPQPISILFNLIFVPIFSIVLFPITWLLVVFPFFSTVVDQLWNSVFFVLKTLAVRPMSPVDFHFTSTGFLWFWLGVLLVFAELSQRQKRRRVVA